jgi:hypothetical protein
MTARFLAAGAVVGTAMALGAIAAGSFDFVKV